MCDGVLLLVDAFEGTMPQTRFVLQKALALGKKPIVVINKVDKPNCRPEVVNEQVFDLMFSLDATEEQLDYKTIYGSAKQGWMSHKWNEPTDSIVPLLDAIIDEIPEPKIVGGTPQMLITSLEYSAYTGRIAVGKVTRGSLKAGQMVTLAKRDGVTMQKTRIKELMVFEGLGKKKVEEVPAARSAPSWASTASKSATRSATTRIPNRCPPSPSTNPRCRCSSRSTTRPSSARTANTSPRATSRSGSTASWRRTSPCA